MRNDGKSGYKKLIFIINIKVHLVILKYCITVTVRLLKIFKSYRLVSIFFSYSLFVTNTDQFSIFDLGLNKMGKKYFFCQ